MEEFLGKKYIFVKSENDDEYFQFIGVSYIKRKLARTIRFVICLKKNGDGTYTLEVTSTLASSVTIFTPGVEFDEVKLDGNKARSLITLDGNKMTHRQKENGIVSTHVREFFPDKMLETTTAEGFDKVTNRVYEPVT